MHSEMISTFQNYYYRIIVIQAIHYDCVFNFGKTVLPLENHIYFPLNDVMIEQIIM